MKKDTFPSERFVKEPACKKCGETRKSIEKRGVYYPGHVRNCDGVQIDQLESMMSATRSAVTDEALQTLNSVNPSPLTPFGINHSYRADIFTVSKNARTIRCAEFNGGYLVIDDDTIAFSPTLQNAFDSSQ